VSIAVKNFGVCDFSRLAVTDWRSRRWRLCFLALMTATRIGAKRGDKQNVHFIRLKRKIGSTCVSQASFIGSIRI